MDQKPKRKRVVELSAMDDSPNIPEKSGVIGTNELIMKRKLHHKKKTEEMLERPMKKQKCDMDPKGHSKNHDSTHNLLEKDDTSSIELKSNVESTQTSSDSSEVKTVKNDPEDNIVEVTEGVTTKKVILTDRKHCQNFRIDWNKYFVPKNTSFAAETSNFHKRRKKTKKITSFDQPSTSFDTNKAPNCSKPSDSSDTTITEESSEIYLPVDLKNININNPSDNYPQKQPKIPGMKKKRIIHYKKEHKQEPSYTIVEKFKNDDVNHIQVKIETAEASKVKNKKNTSKTLLNFIQEQKLTYRVMKRVNFILKMVKQEKVIVDTMKVVKAIREEELNEGYTVNIDKKSILRLVLKLSEYGLLKYRKATLKNESIEKMVTFICDVNVENEHSVITSVLEQSKLKFFIMSKQEEPIPKTIEKIEPVTTINRQKNDTNTDEIQFTKPDPNIVYKYNRTISKKYGYRPKFARCRILHELLFYIIYENKSQEMCTSHELDQLFNEHGGTYHIFENCTPAPVYTRDISWKMFIPPLRKHDLWPEGWIILTDIILRLPLYIFINCFNMSFEVPHLEEYLTHPVRKHMLIKNLPPGIRNGLIYNKKLTYILVENLKNLCYVGLIRFGPQKMKEKDQMFIYVNRKATLYNTVISSPGYIQVSDHKEYDKIDYTFNHLQDVEQYWYDMWSICINTPLGYRSSVEGEYVVIENCWAKPALIDTTKAYTQEEATLNDIGTIPGDKKGAAGLDSSLFAHLKRNWNWINAMPCGTQTISKIKKEKKSPKKDETPKEIPEKKEKKSKPLKYKIRPLINKEKIRHIKPKKKTKKKIIYDEKDQLCLKKMRKLRTDWSELEDHCLLLCAIAQAYLCPNFRKQRIEQVIFRDILHKLVPYSNDKTSRSVHRRIVYILKNAKTRKSMLMCLEEIKHCEYVTEKFGRLLKEYQNSVIPDPTLNIAFTELVGFLNLKYNKQVPKTTNSNRKNIPDTIIELKGKYDLTLHCHKKTNYKFKDIESTHDIECDTVRSVIHSSLCSTKDKTSWAFQLFKIYQQYPEPLLRQVISKLRLDKMASMKKTGLLKIRASTTSSILQSPFKLSINYVNQLQNTKISFKSLIQANNFVQNFMEWIHSYDDDCFDITYSDHGTSLIIENVLRKLNLEVIFEHPDQVIILDPVIAKDKTYERILNKYYDILKAQNGINLDETKGDSDSDEGSLNIVDQQLLNAEIKNPSRIGFHMMRAEMFDCNEKNNIQHMHDYFVVQASKMFLKPLDVNQTIKLEKEVKDMTSIVIHDIKNGVIIPDSYTNINSDDIKRHFCDLDITTDDIEYIEKIKCHIYNAKEVGLTINELKSIQPDTVDVILTLKEVLDILKLFHIILRVGVTCIRFVHFDYKKPWLTHADRILRYEREKMSKDLIPSKWKGKNILKIEDYKKDRKLKILVSPWIRLDGTLNRRVLDRWMATLVSLTIELAGVRLIDLFAQFDYLKPSETIYLIEQLVKINCVKLIKVKKPKITLFSEIEDFGFEDADILDDPKDILVEPTEDSFFNYSVFVGAKSYNTNFVD